MKRWLLLLFLPLQVLASFPPEYQYEDRAWFWNTTSVGSCSVTGQTNKAYAAGLSQLISAFPSGLCTGSYTQTVAPHIVTNNLGHKTVCATYNNSGGTQYCISYDIASCGSGYSQVADPVDSTHYTCRTTAEACPSNSTLYGGSCTCSAGYVEDGSSCVLPTCTSTSAVEPDAYYEMGENANDTTAIGPFICHNGCRAMFSGTAPAASYLATGIRKYLALGGYDYTGNGVSDQCSTGTSKPSSLGSVPTTSCASGDFAATVNGKTKCYSPAGQARSDDATGPTKTTTNTTTDNPDGSKTITTVVTNNTTHQSTTTSITYASGTPVPDLPSSITEPINDAAGLDPVTGEKDGTQADFCAEHPDAASCAELGMTADTETLGTQNVTIDTLTPVTFTESNICPADVPLPHGAAFS